MDQKKLFELSDNSSYTTLSYAEFTVLISDTVAPPGYDHESTPDPFGFMLDTDITSQIFNKTLGYGRLYLGIRVLNETEYNLYNDTYRPPPDIWAYNTTSLDFSLVSCGTSCRYFNPKTYKWQTDGMRVRSENEHFSWFFLPINT